MVMAPLRLAEHPPRITIGNNSVVLRVSDGTTHTDQSFTMAVANGNHAPVFSDSLVNTVLANNASDMDGSCN